MHLLDGRWERLSVGLLLTGFWPLRSHAAPEGEPMRKCPATRLLAFLCGAARVTALAQEPTPLGWTTHDDAKGYSIATPPGWKFGSTDSRSGRIALQGPNGEQVIVWPASVDDHVTAFEEWDQSLQLGSTAAAGTIIQTVRGNFSFFAKRYPTPPCIMGSSLATGTNDFRTMQKANRIRLCADVNRYPSSSLLQWFLRRT
jgi:hypothetical protein